MNDFIAITNRQLCKKDFLTQIKIVAKLHPNAIILREKDLEDEAYKELANNVFSICRKEKVGFFVHQRVNIARHIGCKNIHLPNHVAVEYQNQLDDFEQISVACHSLEDVKKAEKAGATRIILGTIFETDCKKGLKGKGTSFVKEICCQTNLPVYAIGGIKENNIAEVIKAGAKGGCMMSGFMNWG